MSVTAVRTVTTSFSGDEAAVGAGSGPVQSTNSDAPGSGAYLVNLSSGANTITLPTGHTVYGVNIFPPSGNTTSMLFKSVTGDAGVGMHLTKACSFAFASSVTTFVITTGGAMSLRLEWW